MKGTCILAAFILTALLAALPAAAQPLAKEIHYWYIDTPHGQFGFRDVEIVSSEFVTGTLNLGR
jgi:hypothetical protein